MTARLFQGFKVLQLRSALGFTGTRTANTYADIDSTNGKVDITTAGGDLFVMFSGYATNGTANVAQSIAVRLDSGSDVGAMPVYSYLGLANFPTAATVIYHFQNVSAGAHTIYARHVNSSASGTMNTTGAALIVMEVRRPA